MCFNIMYVYVYLHLFPFKAFAVIKSNSQEENGTIPPSRASTLVIVNEAVDYKKCCYTHSRSHTHCTVVVLCCFPLAIVFEMLQHI